MTQDRQPVIAILTVRIENPRDGALPTAYSLPVTAVRDAYCFINAFSYAIVLPTIRR